MKLDVEQVLCHGTVDNKSDCKPIGYDNAAINSVGQDSENELENKDHNGTFCHLKAREGKADRLECAVNNKDGWTTPNLDLSICMDDSTQEKKLRDFVAPISLGRSSLEIESFEKDSVFYVDKSVMEPELPELVVCYKEKTYHVVKEICVDEGFPSKDKFLFDTDVDEKDWCTYLDEDINSEKAQEKELFSLGELFSAAEMGQELLQPKSSDNSMDEAKEESERPGENAISKTRACKETENGDKQEFLVSAIAPSVTEELTCGHEEVISQNLGIDSAAKASANGNDGTVLLGSLDSATEESENESKEEASECHKVGDKSYNSKVETKSIAFDINSSEATRSWGGEGSQTSGSMHPETQNSSRPEDIGAESFSSQLQYTHGESSFSAACPVSGLISYSGPIAYSGSLSHRSDSSTTSTRSFAFPILQTEWNSSPARMAKADRRCFQKRKGWRQCLLCCRF